MQQTGVQFSLLEQSKAKPKKVKDGGGSDVEGKAVTEEGILRVDHREDHGLTQGRFKFQNQMYKRALLRATMKIIFSSMAKKIV